MKYPENKIDFLMEEINKKKNILLYNKMEGQYNNLSRQEIIDLLNDRVNGFKEDKKSRGHQYNKSRDTLISYLKETDLRPYQPSEFSRLQEAVKGDKNFNILIDKNRINRTKEGMRAFIQDKNNNFKKYGSYLNKKYMDTTEYSRVRSILKTDDEFKRLVKEGTLKRNKKDMIEYLENKNIQEQRTIFRDRDILNQTIALKALKEYEDLLNESIVININVLLRNKFNDWKKSKINITDILSRLSRDKFFLMVKHKEVGSNISLLQFIPIRQTNFNEISAGLFNKAGGVFIRYANTKSSDDILEIENWEQIEELKIISIDDYLKMNNIPINLTKGYKTRKTSGFYKYSIKVEYINEFNLDKYQIFNNGKTDKWIKEYDNGKDKHRILKGINKQEDKSCLLHTLELSGIPDNKIQEIIAFLCLRDMEIDIPQNRLKDIAKILNRRLCIMTEKLNEDSKYRHRRTFYGNEEDPILEIGQDDNHYFLYENTPYTGFYLKNYHQIQDDNNKGYIKPKTYEQRYIFTKIQKSVSVDKRVYTVDKKQVVYVDSLDLVLFLKKNNFMEEYTKSRVYSNNYIATPSLDNIEADQDDNILNTETSEGKADMNYYIIISADTESMVKTTDDKNCIHKAISFSYRIHGEQNNGGGAQSEPKVITDTRNVRNIYENIEKSLYNDINNIIKIRNIKDPKIIMYFHNLKYDMSLFKGKLYSDKELSKGGVLYSKNIRINKSYPWNKKAGLEIECRDSMKLFNYSLNNSASMLGVKISKKEAIGYTYHNIYNMNNHICNVEDYKKHIKPIHRELLLENLKNNPVIYEYNEIDNTFNPTKYYNDYLKQDVNVLHDCINACRNIIYEITKQDIYTSLTISSIADKYIKSNDCYLNCYKVKGLLREYIQRTIKGGRVFVNPEYRLQSIEIDIVDFDAVSLYPSSMVRLCKEYGLPTGEIKKIPEGVKVLEEIPFNTFFCCRIMINSINKKQQIPSISIKKGLTLQYINELPDGKPFEDYVNKITLEDYIKYHDIEYEILDGVYWDDVEVNRDLGDMMVKLHEERKLHKKTNKPLATLIKLIMNSIYGKTCQARSDKKIVYQPVKKIEKYIKDNFGLINSIETIKNDEDIWEDESKNNKIKNVRVEVRDFDNSWSFNYIGSMILAMSKRIMNEVFEIMNDNKMPVYYTDTDSIHMRGKDLEVLEKIYKDTYGRNLTEENEDDLNLGQLHTDFNQDKKTENIKSILHIPVAPKLYMDLLIGEMGEKLYMSTHIRIKGITENGINNTIDTIKKSLPSNKNRHKKLDSILKNRGLSGTPLNKINIEGDFDNIEATIRLFDKIRAGEKVDFIMNPENGISMDFSKQGVLNKDTNSFIKSIKITGTDDTDIE